jgi:long-chain acyl-CoA synthetase
VQLSDLDSAKNLVELFLKRADEGGDKPFLGAKRGGQWQTISWREASERVCLLAENLRKLGLVEGDRVMLVSENRPEWCIADLGIMAAGLITVPTYTTNTERDHAHILDNSGARAVIVSTEKLSAPLIPAIFGTGLAEHIIPIDGIRQYQGGNLQCHPWSTMLEGDAAAARTAVEERIATIQRDRTACIIYTSGTGGAPRGVMQHHGALLHNVAGAADIISTDFGWGDEIFLSFLPASHAYEHMGGQMFPIALGGQIYYAESLEKLAANIEEVQPTIMVVVPRLFEMLRARIMKSVEQGGKLSAFLLDTALKIGKDRHVGRMKPWDWPMDQLLSATLRRKVKAKVGKRTKAWVSGGAPLNPEVGIFFESLGITFLQGYG